MGQTFAVTASVTWKSFNCGPLAFIFNVNGSYAGSGQGGLSYTQNLTISTSGIAQIAVWVLCTLAENSVTKSAVASVTVFPNVTLSFRNSGSQSADNENFLLNQIGVTSLGLDNSPTFRNAVEIQGTISPSGFEGATYDFKRVFTADHEAIVNGVLETLDPAGDSDDSHNDDEDLTPENDHIYSVDAPGGFIAPNDPGDEGDTDIQRAKFREWVECTVEEETKKCSDDLDWCFVISLKYSGGQWIRDPAGTNVIQTGDSCY